MSEMFQPPFDAALMNRRILNQYDTHDRQTCGGVQLLRRRSDSDEPEHIGYAQIQQNRQQIRNISLSSFAEDIVKHAVQLAYRQLDSGRFFPGIIFMFLVKIIDTMTRNAITPQVATTPLVIGMSIFPSGMFQIGSIASFSCNSSPKVNKFTSFFRYD